MVIGTIGKAMLEFGGFFTEVAAGKIAGKEATRLVRRLTPEVIQDNFGGKAIKVTRKAVPFVASIGGQYVGRKLYFHTVVLSCKAFGIALEDHLNERSLPKKTVKIKAMKTKKIDEPEKEKKSKKKKKDK